MRNIGFNGGCTLVELGSVSDMILFFDCIEFFAKKEHPGRDFNLLTDRLYKRYLKLEEVEAAITLMDMVHQSFMKTPSSSIEWDRAIQSNPENSSLNPDLPRLSDVFSRYFSAFSECVESAKLMYEDFKSYPDYEYQPVKIVVADMPLYIEDNERPLEAYDALGADDLPFWQRKA